MRLRLAKSWIDLSSDRSRWSCMYVAFPHNTGSLITLKQISIIFLYKSTLQDVFVFKSGSSELYIIISLFLLDILHIKECSKTICICVDR